MTPKSWDYDYPGPFSPTLWGSEGGCPRGGVEWGTLRIPGEDWGLGTLGKIGGITTPPYIATAPTPLWRAFPGALPFRDPSAESPNGRRLMTGLMPPIDVQDMYKTLGAAKDQGIGKDVPRAQRTPMGNSYISPI